MRLTLQQAFDKGLTGIRNQDYASSKNALGCAYNGPNNTHCWIGHCVDPALATDFNGNSLRVVHFLAKKGEEDAVKFMALLPENIEQLARMQFVHDTYAGGSPAKFELEAWDLAQALGLIYTPPEKKA